jgi:hypothetical protein
MLRLWAVSGVSYGSTMNEPTGKCNWELSDKKRSYIVNVRRLQDVCEVASSTDSIHSMVHKFRTDFFK